MYSLTEEEVCGLLLNPWIGENLEEAQAFPLPLVFFWYSEVYRPKGTALLVSQIESQGPLQFSPAAQVDTPGWSREI